MPPFFKDPPESALADLVREHVTLRGVRVKSTGQFYIWPADQNWHVEMADHLERIGEIEPNAELDRLVISRIEDAWFLYRDEP